MQIANLMYNLIVQSMARHRKIPMLGANVANSVMDGQTSKQVHRLTLVHPYHEGQSCSKFG